MTRTRNLEVVWEATLRRTGARAFMADLGRELAVGEACSVQYAMETDEAYVSDTRGPADDEAMFVAEAGVPLLSVEVAFASTATPARVRRVMTPSLERAVEDVPDVTNVDISEFGIAQLVLAPAPPGVHGLRWEWDEGHPS